MIKKKKNNIINIKVREVAFYAKAGEASTTPPLGTLLTPHGIDVKQFCNMFNTETKDLPKGVIVRVILNIYKNNTFTYTIKGIPLHFLFELASEELELKYNYRNYRGIEIIDLYLITLYKCKEYDITDIKELFKLTVHEAKKNGYKIIEHCNEEIYYFYL